MSSDEIEEKLYEAIIKHSRESVKELLQQGALGTVVCKSGETAIGLAAKLGDVPVLQTLVNAVTARSPTRSCPCRKRSLPRDSSSGWHLNHRNRANSDVQRETSHPVHSTTSKKARNNVGYFVFVHEESTKQNVGDENQNRPKSKNRDTFVLPVNEDSCYQERDDDVTPEGMDNLEWDTEGMENQVIEENIEVDTHDQWVLFYQNYAEVLDYSSALLNSGGQDMGINQADQYGRNALHYAAEHGHFEIVKILCDAGCNPNVADTSNTTPVHIATNRGYDNVLLHLLACGAKAQNRTGETRATALHIAASRGYPKCARALLENGANPDALDSTDQTPMLIAVSRSHPGDERLELVKVLLEYGAKLNIEDVRGYTPLYYAVQRKNLHMVQLLIEAGARVTQSHFLLHDAVLKRNEEMAKLLVQAGSHVNLHNTQGQTPLNLACSSRQPGLVRMFLESSADPNVPGCAALFSAMKDISEPFIFTEIFQLLVEFGADLDMDCPYYGTPLFYALQHDLTMHAALVIKHGCDVNKRSVMMDFWDNVTFAYKCCNFQCIRLLVLAGADIRNSSFLMDVAKADSPSAMREWTLHVLSNPLNLSDLCRIIIRNCVGKPKLKKIECLHLPKMIQRYLMLENV